MPKAWVFCYVVNIKNDRNSFFAWIFVTEENVMNQYVKRTQRDYPLSFKLAVVEQVEKGEMTYRQAQDRYGIQGRSTVLKWLRKFGQLDWLSPSPAKMYGVNMPKMPLTPEQRIKELE